MSHLKHIPVSYSREIFKYITELGPLWIPVLPKSIPLLKSLYCAAEQMLYYCFDR